MATSILKIKIALNEMRARNPNLFDEEIKFAFEQGYVDVMEFFKNYFSKLYKNYCKSVKTVYNGEMESSHVIDYLKNVPTKFNEVIEHLLTKNANAYWDARGSYISTDQRERRFIMTLPTVDETVKNILKKEEVDDYMTRALGKNRGKAIDLAKKILVDASDINTVFEDGRSVRGQQPGGVHFIIPKGYTLKFCPVAQSVTFVKPDVAIALDNVDENTAPMRYYFVNGPGVRTGSYRYNMFKCQEFYDYVSSLYPVN